MPLSIELAIKISELPFIQEVNLLKQEVEAFRPLDNETEQKIIQKFRLLWNYHSNAIEGNQLTYGETYAFLMEGVTAKGKTLKDHLDIKGHDETVKYLFDLIKSKEYEITEAEIRNLHKMLLKEPYEVDAVTLDGKPTKRNIQIGEYKSFPNHVQTSTGEIHYYATPQETPIRMGELMAWYKEAKENTAIHPLVIATLFHHEFTNIHPFDDGNGRMGRLLLNLMVQQYGYTPIVVMQQDRMAYYQVLRQADAGEYLPINEYMSELMKESLSLYIKGAKGESIEEEDDIDKEIMLFKRSVKPNQLNKLKEGSNQLIDVFKTTLIPFLIFYSDKIKHLSELFEEIKLEININVKKEFWSRSPLLTKLTFEKDYLKKQVEDFIELFQNDNKNHIQNIFIMLHFTSYKKRDELNFGSFLIVDVSSENYFRILNSDEITIYQNDYFIEPDINEVRELANQMLRNFISTLKTVEENEQKK